MAKMPAEEKNYYIELNRNVCKTRQITIAKNRSKSFQEPSVLHASIAGRGNRKYTGQIK